MMINAINSLKTANSCLDNYLDLYLFDIDNYHKQSYILDDILPIYFLLLPIIIASFFSPYIALATAILLLVTILGNLIPHIGKEIEDRDTHKVYKTAVIVLKYIGVLMRGICVAGISIPCAVLATSIGVISAMRSMFIGAMIKFCKKKITKLKGQSGHSDVSKNAEIKMDAGGERSIVEMSIRPLLTPLNSIYSSAEFNSIRSSMEFSNAELTAPSEFHTTLRKSRSFS